MAIQISYHRQLRSVPRSLSLDKKPFSARVCLGNFGLFNTFCRVFAENEKNNKLGVSYEVICCVTAHDRRVISKSCETCVLSKKQLKPFPDSARYDCGLLRLTNPIYLKH